VKTKSLVFTTVWHVNPHLASFPWGGLPAKVPGLNIGRSVIVEHAIAPPAAVREPPAVLHHEVDVMLGTWHRRCGERLHLFRVPVDLRQLGAVRERLAVAGNEQKEIPQPTPLAGYPCVSYLISVVTYDH
jgi:hypothetical protein